MHPQCFCCVFHVYGKIIYFKYISGLVVLDKCKTNPTNYLYCVNLFTKRESMRSFKSKSIRRYVWVSFKFYLLNILIIRPVIWLWWIFKFVPVYSKWILRNFVALFYFSNFYSFSISISKYLDIFQLVHVWRKSPTYAIIITAYSPFLGRYIYGPILSCESDRQQNISRVRCNFCGCRTYISSSSHSHPKTPFWHQYTFFSHHSGPKFPLTTIY